MSEEPVPYRFLARFIATLKCRVCGETQDPKRAEVLGEKDGALVVRLNCRRCGEQSTVALMQRTEERPRPIRDSSRMGGSQVTPGGIIEKPAPVAVSSVMVVCPVCKVPTRVGIRVKEIKGETVRVRVCRRDGCGQEIDR